MNNNIQVVLKSSTAEMSLNDHETGIYVVPQLDGLTGLPEIRSSVGVNAGYDGGWTTAQNYDARSITIRGVIANENKAEVERMRKQLTSLLGQGKNEQLILDIVTEAGAAYEILVRTMACEMAMQRVLTQQEFLIQLRADDPLIYDNTEAGEPTIVQVQKALGGFQIDFELPLAIGGGEDTATLDNHGLEQVYPIVKMYGSLHNPKIINQTTNQYMEIDATLGFAAGSPYNPTTATGNPVQFNDAISAPLNGLSIYGNTTQNGTPTPSAPVTVQTVTGENVVEICGKNLFNKNNSGILDDVRVSTSNGKTYGSVGSHVSYFIKVKPSTNYALTTGRNAFYSWYSAPSEDSYISGSGWQDRHYFKSPANAQYIRFDFADGNIVQFVEGTSVGAYEPYQGQSYEVNLGKNLFEVTASSSSVSGGVTYTKISDSSFSIASDGSSSWARADIALPQPLELNTTYTFKANFSSMNPSITSVRVAFRTASAEAFSRTLSDGQTAAIPTGSNVITLLRIYISTNTAYSGTVTFTDVQLEKGSTATTYAAYFEPIELCKIGDYQDYIYKSGGKWYVHKEVDRRVLDGSEDWALAERSGSSNGVFYIDYNKIGTVGAKNNGAFSNYARFISGYSYLVGQFDTHFSQWRFYAPNNTIALNEWKTNLGATPLVLYYLPATPTDTEITNQALIEQLEAVLEAQTQDGENTITLTSTSGASGTLAVSYYTEKSSDTRDEVIIDSRMRTITLNGVDIYHLKTDGSEFLMLAPGKNKLILQSDITSDNGYAEVNYKQGYLSI